MRAIKLLLAILPLSLWVSCKQDITDAFAHSGIIEVSNDEIHCLADSVGKTILVTGGVDWSIDDSQTDDWCHLEPIKGHEQKDYISIFLSPNEGVESRETLFAVVGQKQRKEVKIVQLGSDPEIVLGRNEMTIGRDTAVLRITVSSNVEYELKPDGTWFEAKIETSEQYGSRLIVNVEPNASNDDRTGEILFESNVEGASKTFSFLQKHEDLEYSPVGAENVEGNKMIKIISATASSNVDGKGPEKSYDGSIYSHFHSAWQDVSTPFELEYTLEPTDPLSYIRYIPYGAEMDKAFKTVKVWVKSSGGEYELDQTVTLGKNTSSYIIFDNAIEHPEKIKLVVTATQKHVNGTMAGTCAEIEFYSASPLYDHIFTDQSYSELVKGVTLDDILALDDDFFSNLASYLYHGTYNMSRIRSFRPHTLISTGQYVTANISKYGNLDNATGITVKKGEQLLLFADKLGGQTVNLMVIDPFNPAAVKKLRIFEGINRMTMDIDGHLYIEYNTRDAMGDPVRIHIAGGEVNSLYRLGDNGSLDLNRGSSEFIDIQGEKAHLLYKKSSLRACSSIDNLLKRYDRIIDLQHRFAGYDKYNKPIDHRLVFVESELYGDAVHTLLSGYILCPSDDMPSLCNEAKIESDVLWLLSHKIGHNVVSRGLYWDGVTETTPNLYTLYVERELGLQSSLWRKGLYEAAFNNLLIPEKKLASTDNEYNGMPEKIVPFWQMELYANYVLGLTDFYPDLHEKLRMRGMPRDMEFVEWCGTLTGKDLTQFFTDWGFAAKAKTFPEKAPAGLKYICETNLDLFKNPKPPTAGTYTVSGSTVTITGASHVIAYEVRHGYYPTQVFLTDKFTVSDWTPTMQIIGIGVNGEEVSITKQ